PRRIGVPRVTAKLADGVRASVDRMRARDELARFGEEQEQDPVDDGERLVERLDIARAVRRRQCSNEGLKRLDHSVLKVGPHAILKGGCRDHQLVNRHELTVERLERAGARQSEERGQAVGLESIGQSEVGASANGGASSREEREKGWREDEAPAC